MKVLVDQENCIKCGACEDNCPDIFVMDESGKAAIIDEFQTDNPGVGEVKDDLKPCAEDAADNCPVDVITVE